VGHRKQVNNNAIESHHTQQKNFIRLDKELRKFRLTKMDLKYFIILLEKMLKIKQHQQKNVG